MRTVHSAKSRASINCTGSVGAPGASTGPPRSRRTGQYVKRSLSSPGPTINPGRMTNVWPGNPLFCFLLGERLERAVKLVLGILQRLEGLLHRVRAAVLFEWTILVEAGF